ncbi:hypothetical protein PUR49_05300 [Streptomyces sp. BE147]|uniref:hypothetical protein n=1 Tax=Streptomyces sp. BE147 TaxID=3002524 RepID=UPI002E75DEEC|nr:hypothetical protein [Streptomyces sp. BE147]MEE1735931.1 hypothetical protein [Streptomyces sp. BE147]
MTTPMTPDREHAIRTLDLLELMSDRVAPVISGHLAALLAEVDRLRKQVTELEAASPWERAVAGLNALADADIAFWIEPDGHISSPFSDEHIEWDQTASRWVLTHDDSEPAPVDPHESPLHPMTADEWNRRYPVGTPVLAYPGTRDDEPLDTVTRTPAWTLGHGAACVSVEGAGGGIHLTHVDPVDPTEVTP